MAISLITEYFELLLIKDVKVFWFQLLFPLSSTTVKSSLGFELFIGQNKTSEDVTQGSEKIF